MGIYRKAQAATEYLVIIGVVLLLVLISITLLDFFPGMGSDSKISQSDSYWQAARPFAILGHTMGGAPEGTTDYWTFDEGSGTSAADSVGGHTATVTNATWIDGKFGSALNFSGSRSYATSTSGISTTNGVTIEAWINPSFINSSTYHTIALIGSSSSNVSGHHWLYLRSGRIYLTYANGTTAPSKYVTYTPPLNTWTHIMVTDDYDAKQIKFYADGVQIGATQTYVDTPLPVSNKAVRIGGYSTSSYMFNGAIDNFRIYDSALTPGDASSLVNEGMQMVVQLNGQNYKTISSISIGDQNATVNSGIGAGEKKTLTLAINHGICTTGSLYEFNVSITYSTPDLGDIKQTGAQKLVGKCS